MAEPVNEIHVIPAVQNHARLEELVDDAHGLMNEYNNLVADRITEAYEHALDEALHLLGRDDLR